MWPNGLFIELAISQCLLFHIILYGWKLCNIFYCRIIMLLLLHVHKWALLIYREIVKQYFFPTCFCNHQLNIHSYLKTKRKYSQWYDKQDSIFTFQRYLIVELEVIKQFLKSQYSYYRTSSQPSKQFSISFYHMKWNNEWKSIPYRACSFTAMIHYLNRFRLMIPLQRKTFFLEILNRITLSHYNFQDILRIIYQDHHYSDNL